MYNPQMLDLAADEIEDQIHAMPRNYASFDFCTEFKNNYPQRYREFVLLFTD